MVFMSTPNVSRRRFLRLGSLAIGGFSLPHLLQAESESGIRSSQKSVIMVFLEGGPSHLDTWDMKEDGPTETRGEFQSIETSVPGIRICEHLPKLAGQIDKFTVIRSIVDSMGQHSAYQCETGHTNRPTEPAGGWPSMGAVIQKFVGDGAPGVPASVTLSPYTRTGGGFFGAAYQSFKPNSGALANMILREEVPLKRLEERLSLFNRIAAASQFSPSMPTAESTAEFHRKAYEVLSAPDLVRALDQDAADPADRDRYRSTVSRRYFRHVDAFLSARRLVEAGARYVMVSIGGFDTHKNNFGRLKTELLPILDSGLTNLVTDLHDRGMDRDVSVIAWGEFGRSPAIQGVDGRDHWQPVNTALLAGGGMRTGQIIGRTNRQGGSVVSRPVYTGEICATLYRNCNLDPARLIGMDLSGRPRNLVDRNQAAIAELF